MSPIMMAILGLLAYKTVKSLTGGPASAGPASAGVAPGAGTINSSVPGSGGGGLGGLFAGRDGGNVLSGGLNDLLKQFQQNGQGEVAKSWIGSGPNKTIAPNDLASALGADRINALVAQSGLARDDLLNGLSQQLPDVVDQLTPNGRVPTEQEAARLI
jgi:uncharacterized protein YidB (DUF937 family)